MTRKNTFTVGQLARLAKISVRALRHYDEIGLLCPSGRSQAGYRLYVQEDLVRLQRIMSFKLLGFPLEEIRRLLADPNFDARSALQVQKRLLTEKQEQLHALIIAVDAALDALTKGRNMDPTKMFDPFEGFDPTQYEEEVKQRWGTTEAYRVSAERTARYTAEQWAALKKESDDIYRELAAKLADGRPPTDPAVLELVERHRLHIERWFYPCSPEMHRGLGEMYVSDPRFGKNIDGYQPGLAAFLCEAIRANGARNRRTGG